MVGVECRPILNSEFPHTPQYLAHVLQVIKMKLRILLIALSIPGLFFGLLAARTLTNTLPSPTTRGPIQNIRFTVYDTGIYPRQLRAKPGVVAIVLEDRTRQRRDLVIERVTGGSSSVGGISIPVGQSRTRAEFRLGVGRYRVSDATNPANQAELIVEQ